jgi:N-acetylglucosaminyldiphosphoundecaprenol N-acetyl-beta-D-mannosaminyltransferase
MKRLTIGKVPIDVLTFAEALDAIEALVTAGAGGTVFTPNLDHIVLADENPKLEAAYGQVSLSLADGSWVVWASRLLETSLPEKINGSDLIGPLLERAGQRQWRVALFGAAPGVAEKAAEVARAKWNTQIVFIEAPMVKLDDDAQLEAIAQRIAASKPDVVLVALGAPKQELLIMRIRQQVKPAVLLGVGASLDFVAGTMKRAPRLVSSLGLEWAFRLVQEPRRLWRRYLVNDPKFALILARTIRRG